MAVSIQTPGIYVRIIRAISLFVPGQSRLEWRREWEAEIVSRWLLLKEWERLNGRSKLDLFKRVHGALSDVMWFQQKRTRFVIVALNMLVALLTGFGALEALIIQGVGDRWLQTFLLSLAGIVVSSLFVTSGIAVLGQWPGVRRLIILTGTLSILVHVYGALPPHRNMGFFVLIVGAGYGLVMLIAFEWQGKRTMLS
jgi:hypothetical protein